MEQVLDFKRLARFETVKFELETVLIHFETLCTVSL